MGLLSMKAYLALLFDAGTLKLSNAIKMEQLHLSNDILDLKRKTIVCKWNHLTLNKMMEAPELSFPEPEKPLLKKSL
jgi:hypothetical protein